MRLTQDIPVVLGQRCWDVLQSALPYKSLNAPENSEMQTHVTLRAKFLLAIIFLFYCTFCAGFFSSSPIARMFFFLLAIVIVTPSYVVAWLCLNRSLLYQAHMFMLTIAVVLFVIGLLLIEKNDFVKSVPSLVIPYLWAFIVYQLIRYREYKLRIAKRSSFCKQCLYDMKGLDDKRTCPECGAERLPENGSVAISSRTGGRM